MKQNNWQFIKKDKNGEIKYNFMTKEEIAKIMVANIKKYRLMRGFTQYQLSLWADMNYEYYRKVESGKGKRGFAIDYVFRISKVLNVTMNDIFEGTFIEQDPR